MGGLRFWMFFLSFRFGGIHFQVRENGFSAGEHRLWKAGEASDLDAVGFICSTGEDFVEKDNFFVPFTHSNVAIDDSIAGVGEVGEFMVMGGEEGAAFDLVVQMLGDCPRDGETVESCGSAADLIENDQRFFGGMIEYESGFRHLDHEGRLTTRKIIGCADAAEDSIRKADGGGVRWDISADLCHQGDESKLTNISGFTSHVGTG